jgi:hypothetical protein
MPKRKSRGLPRKFSVMRSRSRENVKDLIKDAIREVVGESIWISAEKRICNFRRERIRGVS